MPTPSFPFSFFKGRPNLDRAFCTLFLKDRLQLPQLALSRYFPDFTARAVRLQEVPRGDWSTPMHDVVMLLKIVLNAQPSRLMEVGSFRGYTALLMAQHMHEGAALVTVDRAPDHGEAYRDSPEAAQIERRVGETSPEMFAGDQDQSYDLIFLDAGHFYEEVRYDTELLLPLLADDGYLVWHDYANWGYFTRHNGVPEYLNELAASLPIAHIAGTGMAIHSPQWGSLGHDRFNDALIDVSSTEKDVWSTEAPR